MSTSEELGEIPPSPLEIIAEFEEAHRAFVDIGLSVAASPTAENIDIFEDNGVVLKQAAVPLFRSHFFADSENEMLIDAGIGALVNSGDELHAAAQSLAPDDLLAAFSIPELRDTLRQAIYTQDMSDFSALVDTDDDPFQLVVEGTPELTDTQPEEPSDVQVMKVFWGDYKDMVDQFGRIVMTHDNVEEFMDEQDLMMQAIAERAEHRDWLKHQAITVGAVAIVSFAGAFGGAIAAHRFNRRK